MKKCVKCGSDQPEDAKFCAICGASIEAAAEETLGGSGANDSESVPVRQVVNEPPVAPTPAYMAPAPVEKKGHNGGLIAGLIIAIVFAVGGIVAAVILGLNAMNNKKDDDGDKPGVIGTVDTPPVESGSKVEFGGGYTVTVPDEYVYMFNDEGDLVVMDKTMEEWGIAIAYVDVNTYSTVVANFDQVVANYKAGGASDVTYSNKTVDGVEMYYVDYLYTDGIYRTDTYTKAPDLYILSTTCVDGSGAINHDLLDIAAKILKTVEKRSTIGSRGIKNETLSKIKSSDVDLSGIGK